jgi:Anti-sigma-K factor rskA
MRYTDPALLEHLTSQYVLGTLQGGARRRFERLQLDRIDIRMRVATWEMRLGQLAQSVPPQQVSNKLWPAIAARTLAAAAQTSARAAASASPSKVMPRSSTSSSPWAWLKPAGFTVGGVTAGVLAASALFFTVPTLFVTSDQIAMRTGERLPQSYVGLLTDAQGNGKLLASSLRQGKTMTIKVIGPISAPAAGRLVMWAVPADPAKNGPAFVLGNVPLTGSLVSQLPDTSEKLLSKVSKLIVTVETEPTPTKPSDALVYSCNCAKLW